MSYTDQPTGPGDILALIWQAYLKTFTFRGRARRTEYVAVLVIVGALLSPLINLFIVKGASPAVAALAAVLPLIPLPALATRRAHDFGWTGWPFGLLATAPLISSAYQAFTAGPLDLASRAGEQELVVAIAIFATVVILFLIMLIPGEDGPNRFGSDPREAYG